MSTVLQAEASKPQQLKKMQECFRCKAAGFPNQTIGFEKIGQDSTTGKNIWKLIDENGAEHKHKFLLGSTRQSQPYRNDRPIFRRRRVVDIATVQEVEQVRELLAQGWDFQTSYPATLSNIPHYILVKKE
jgi:hypothetical protein